MSVSAGSLLTPQTSLNELRDKSLWTGVGDNLAGDQNGRANLSLISPKTPLLPTQGGQMVLLGLAWQRAPSSPP